MTLLLDTRSDNFGKIYQTEGPRSSEDLERRRRRFSMANQLFDHDHTNSSMNEDGQSPRFIDSDAPLVEEPSSDMGGEPIHKSESMPSETITTPSQLGGKFDRRYSLGNGTTNSDALEDFKNGKISHKSLSRKSSSAMGKFLKFLKYVCKDQFNTLSSLENLDKEAGKLAELDPTSNTLPIDDPSMVQMPPSIVQDVISYQNKAGEILMDNSDDSGNAPSPRPRERKGSVCSTVSSFGDIEVEDDRHRTKAHSVPPVGNTRNLYMVDERGKIVSLEAHDSPCKGILKTQSAASSPGGNVKEKRKSRARTLSKVGRSKKYANGKHFRFNEFVVIFETYCEEEYDRRMGVDLEQNMMNTLNIKQELNDYKRNEMMVHEESEKFTHYLVI